MGEEPLPPQFVALYNELFAVQDALRTLRSASCPDVNAFGFDAKVTSLLLLASACEGEVCRRRQSWADDRDWDARWHALHDFRPRSHARWHPERSLMEDFFDDALMARANRAAKKRLQRMASRNSHDGLPFLGDTPVSDRITTLRTYSAYCAALGRRPRFKRSKIKGWIAQQLKIIQVIAILISDCLDYSAATSVSKLEASGAFGISFAFATGAADAKWKAR